VRSVSTNVSGSSQAINFLTHRMTCNRNPPNQQQSEWRLDIGCLRVFSAILLCLSMGLVPWGYKEWWCTAGRSNTVAFCSSSYPTLFFFIWSMKRVSNIRQCSVPWIVWKKMGSRYSNEVSIFPKFVVLVRLAYSAGRNFQFSCVNFAGIGTRDSFTHFLARS
jgi:hypothetical protein